MRLLLQTAGEHVSVESSLPWVTELLAESAAGELLAPDCPGPSVVIRVEDDRPPFPTRGLRLLARGAWSGGSEVVVENVCTSGFDLHVRAGGARAEFTYRWRPPPRDRIASRLLRSRFHLLVRAALLQYPALWWAGTRGRVPLHASACVAGAVTPLVVAQSGVGRSTLVLHELERGGFATGDNLAVGDGTTVWGVVEPVRVEGARGRAMPHGRNEAPMPRRVDALVPDTLVVLERGDAAVSVVSTLSTDLAARALVTSTYMAGELRRYWPFAALLSAGTGVGPAHPPIELVAADYVSTLPCLSLSLGARLAPLSQLLAGLEVTA
jgi:hypothetical protein